MALSKTEKVDQIQVLEDGQIQIRTASIIYEGDTELSRAFHRHVLAPDADDITGEDARVQSIAQAVWTNDVKAAYIANKP